MKNFLAFLGLSIAISSLQAASLDLQNATTTWTAYKTEDKTPVSGSFEKIEYKFGKNINDIAKTLEGATAVIDPMSADLQDEVKNANVRGYFFAHFAKKDSIKVKFSNVFLAKDKGSLLASVNMNGKTIKVPMQIEISNGKLVAKGVIDILAFGAKDALKALATQCFDLHSGITWPQVEISFSAPVK